MRPIIGPYSVVPYSSFQGISTRNSDFNTSAEDAALGDEPSTAHISKDGKIAWVTQGGNLDVINTKNATCIASWVFGSILKDPNVVVTCTCECRYEKVAAILVGLETSSGAGMVCVFDIALSRVIKSLDFPHKVSAIELVTGTSGENVPTWALGPQLQHFCGVAAVGTMFGYVYLIDLCLDATECSDELLTNQILFINSQTKGVIHRRQQALSRGEQLGLILDESSHSPSHFTYMKPDGLAMKTFVESDVCVTCLKYIPQTGTLAVGFNFGCYQLWEINSLAIDYSSRFEVDTLPVTHVTYQEPENDPKNFCYLWVGQGPTPLDNTSEELATISLIQLSYSKKTFYNSYGWFYEDLLSVCHRFEFDLTSDPFMLGALNSPTSRLASCYTITDPNYVAPTKMIVDDSFEENVMGPDLSLCVFVWEAQEAGGASNTTSHLAVFDMNRWYHAQMPQAVRYSVTGNLDNCPYFAFYNLDDVISTAMPDTLKAVHIDATSLRRFIPLTDFISEQHFYPTALAFNALCVLETGLVSAKFLGKQRQILADLKRKGPEALLHPSDMYTMCVLTGLLSRSTDTTLHSVSPAFQREAILSLCLDHNMTGFIKECIASWADRDLSSQGCSLKFLLEWTWKKVAHVKDLVDRSCIPLYDWSGIQTDKHLVQTLRQSLQKLQHLLSIFQTFLDLSAPITEQGVSELKSRLSVTQFITEHLKVVLWFVSNSLLPEVDDTQDERENRYSYPVTSLLQAFQIRRQELQKLHSSLNSTTLLMIDGIVQYAGCSLTQRWDYEGGNGLYPPPSLHALLNIYLLEDVSVVEKQSIVMYMLLDLVSVASIQLHEEFSEKIGKFAQTFSISPSHARLVQAFWLLDHQDFEEALNVLLDPMISNNEIEHWQHLQIIKALLYQGQARLALQYIRVRFPAMTTAEEVKLHLTVLMANGLIAEALQYQRKCRDVASQEDLISHLFQACQQMRMLDQLLQLPLNEKEEKKLINYLYASTEPHSEQILVLHYLQQARYIEALRLNEKLKHMPMLDGSVQARELMATRNTIVDGHLKVLPSVQRKLVFDPTPAQKKRAVIKEVTRPKPLSTVVRKSDKSEIVSRAKLIQCVMDKVGEVMEQSEDEMDTEDAVVQKDMHSTEQHLGPFIRTPLTPRAQSRLNREVTSVVYPKLDVGPETSPVETDNNVKRVSMETLHLYPWQQLSDGAQSVVERRVTPITAGEVAKRRLSRRLTADTLAMLKTPPVSRKTPLRGRVLSTAQPTPPSILKVRRLVQRSPSPLVPSASSSSEGPEKPQSSHKKLLGFMDTTVDTPVCASVVERLAQPISSMTSTPKQLRFAESVRPASPSSVSPPSPRSIRDRSPTPEKILLKFASRFEEINPSKASVSATSSLEPELENNDRVTPTELDEVDRKTIQNRLNNSPDDIEMDDDDDEMFEDAPATMVVDSDVTFNFTTTKTLVPSFDSGDNSVDTLPLKPALEVAIEEKPSFRSSSQDVMASTNRTQDKITEIPINGDVMDVDDAMKNQTEESSKDVQHDGLMPAEMTEHDIESAELNLVLEDEIDGEKNSSHIEVSSEEQSEHTSLSVKTHRPVIKPLCIETTDHELSIPGPSSLSPVRRSPRRSGQSSPKTRPCFGCIDLHPHHVHDPHHATDSTSLSTPNRATISDHATQASSATHSPSLPNRMIKSPTKIQEADSSVNDMVTMEASEAAMETDSVAVDSAKTEAMETKVEIPPLGNEILRTPMPGSQETQDDIPISGRRHSTRTPLRETPSVSDDRFRRATRSMDREIGSRHGTTSRGKSPVEDDVPMTSRRERSIRTPPRTIKLASLSESPNRRSTRSVDRDLKLTKDLSTPSTSNNNNRSLVMDKRLISDARKERATRTPPRSTRKYSISESSERDSDLLTIAKDIGKRLDNSDMNNILKEPNRSPTCHQQLVNDDLVTSSRRERSTRTPPKSNKVDDNDTENDFKTVYDINEIHKEEESITPTRRTSMRIASSAKKNQSNNELIVVSRHSSRQSADRRVSESGIGVLPMSPRRSSRGSVERTTLTEESTHTAQLAPSRRYPHKSAERTVDNVEIMSNKSPVRHSTRHSVNRTLTDINEENVDLVRSRRSGKQSVNISESETVSSTSALTSRSVEESNSRLSDLDQGKNKADVIDNNKTVRKSQRRSVEKTVNDHILESPTRRGRKSQQLATNDTELLPGTSSVLEVTQNDNQSVMVNSPRRGRGRPKKSDQKSGETSVVGISEAIVNVSSVVTDHSKSPSRSTRQLMADQTMRTPRRTTRAVRSETPDRLVEGIELAALESTVNESAVQMVSSKRVRKKLTDDLYMVAEANLTNAVGHTSAELNDNTADMINIPHNETIATETAAEFSFSALPNFLFSEPMPLHITRNEDLLPKPDMPVHSFIFSPPLTRTQRRLSLDRSTVPLMDADALRDEPVTPKVRKVLTLKSGKKKISAVDPDTVVSPVETINFLSPFSGVPIPTATRPSRARRAAAATTSTTTGATEARHHTRARIAVLRRKKYGGRV